VERHLLTAAALPPYRETPNGSWWLWLIPLVGLALLALALVSATLISSAEQSASRASHDRAYDVLLESERVISSLGDAQRGERGFLLTGNSAFLEPFTSGSANARRHFRRLSDLLDDNSDQGRRLEELHHLLEETLGFYGRTIELAGTGRRDAAIELVRSGEGKALMDRARSITDAIIETEEKVLSNERAEGAKESRTAEWMSYGLAAAGAGLLIVSIIAVAIAVRRQQQAQAATALAERARALELALETQEALLYEVNHRVKNSLQVVMSLLYLQANQVPDPQAKQALIDARSRVNVIASIHQSLYKSGSHTQVELCQYLEALASATVSSLAAGERLQVAVSCPDQVVLPIAKAVPLALIVAELLTNSIKYAFPDDAAGRISVEAVSEQGSLRLVVSDDGHGLEANFDPIQSIGVGMRIIRALAKQLRAKMDVLEQGRGAGFALTLPLADEGVG
jgi:two-component sensor histidine kinase